MLQAKIAYPLAITMWDFSWLERRWPGAGYEDWDVALDELKAQHPELHKAFVLKKHLDFTWESIAETLQITVWTARQYVAKAEELLRATVAATQPEAAFQFIRDLDHQE